MVDLVGIEPTTSSMPWKRAPSCATGPQMKGQLSHCRSFGLVRQTGWKCVKPPALCTAAGFERGHVLVFVHEEELAVAEALGFAGLACGHIGNQVHQLGGGFVHR